MAFLLLSSLCYLAFPQRSSFRAPLLSEEIGCSPTLSMLRDRERYAAQGPFFYFDPFSLATDGNFSRSREAELKHGRVAMLAISQVVLIPVLKRVDVVPKKIPEGIVKGVSKLEIGDIAKVFIACAILEAFVFVQKDSMDMPGDYGTGYFGVRDKASNELNLVVELEHGRLAMVGFAGYLASDFLTKGQPWYEQWAPLIKKVVKPLLAI